MRTPMNIINQINPDKETWHMKVRVVRLWMLPTFNGNLLPNSMELILVDEAADTYDFIPKVGLTISPLAELWEFKEDSDFLVAFVDPIFSIIFRCDGFPISVSEEEYEKDGNKMKMAVMELGENDYYHGSENRFGLAGRTGLTVNRWNRQYENRLKTVEPAGFRMLCPFPSPPSLHHRRSSIAAASPSPPAPPSSISFLGSSKFKTSNRDIDAPSLLPSTTSSVAVPGHLPRCRPSSPLLRCLTAVHSSFIDLVHFTPSTLASTTSSVVSAPFPVILDDAVLPPLLDRHPLLGSNRKAMDESISQNVAGEAAAPGSNDAANPPASNESQSQTSSNVR
ncbi:hypothetical protein PIB30_068651 [Stylosanthes scabra]|uniref:DUF223 domain-containing protein n=1 Tax=Stylosanthes scabra TaxID=79078 RepID=A0ABU6YNI7_9FABA|nr:hypothetical protein [Stylosanthes scabra]